MQIWLVGDGVRNEEQSKATKGTHFIPYSQFPPKTLRKDCVYWWTPAVIVPKEYENLHACEVNSMGKSGFTVLTSFATKLL